MTKPVKALKSVPSLNTEADIDEAVLRGPKPSLTGLDAAKRALDAANEPAGLPPVGFQAYVPGTEYPPGSFVRMPLDLVIDNPENPRALYPEAELQTLQISIAAIGQKQAAQVFFGGTDVGKYIIKGGHRRHRALTALKQGLINVEVVERCSDSFEEFCQARALNDEAKSHTHLDDAVRFPELMAKYEITEQKKFAAKINMSPSELSRRLKIGTLPLEVLAQLADDIGKFNTEACYYLALIFERRPNREFLQKMIARLKDGMGNHELRTIAANQKEPPASSAGEPSDASPAQAEDGPLTARRSLPTARSDMLGNGRGVVKVFPTRLEVKLEIASSALKQRLYDRFIELCQAEGIVSKDQGAATPS